MAEWLGRALQKLVHRFESGRCLQFNSYTVELQCYNVYIMARFRSWEDYELIDAVATSKSIRSVLLKLRLVPAGGNYVQVKNRISDLKLDNSHFTGKGWNEGWKFDPRKPAVELNLLLADGSRVQSHLLKQRLFKAGLKKPVCELCGWNTRSLDGRIPVELDHANGKRNDNRLENLRILCPNCHSLQPTHRGRNKKVALARVL